MGGRPITAMNIMGMPVETVSNETINLILRGGADKVKEARCTLAGGHTIKNPEPIYGLSVTGVVHPSRMITNAGARPGDLLVLTKPLGTGILTTGIKRDLVSRSDLVAKGVTLMSTLNRPGTDLADRGLVRCATDVTGFGLLGHLRSLCLASGVAAEIDAPAVPVIDPEILTLIEEHSCVPGGTRENLATVSPFLDVPDGVPESLLLLLADAQTSGGLLCCVPREHWEEVESVLSEHDTMSRSIIGRIAEPRSESQKLIALR